MGLNNKVQKGTRMKLQILVPRYNESAEIIKPLLDSIALQQGVDVKNEVGVIIVDDGSSTTLNPTFLEVYPFNIEYHSHEHKGVSAARNACLDYATADYVMYCDADDLFFNACGLWIIFREMKKDFDSLVSVFCEEWRDRETGEILYINHEHDNVFVHGKVHKRQYLIDKNIRWNEALTIHEDSYFNTLCQVLSDNVLYVSAPFYLWKWRDGSICRHDPKYILKTYIKLLDSNDALVQELLNRGLKDKAEMMCVMMIFDSYYAMNKPQWINQENVEYRQAVENRFQEYYAKNKHLWESIDPQLKMQLSTNIRNRQVVEGMQMEKITIDQWLEGR